MTLSVVKIREQLFYLLVFLLPWQTRYIFHDPQLFWQTWEYGRLSVYSWDIILVILTIWLWPKLRQEFMVAFRGSRAFYFYLLLASVAFITGGWAADSLLASYWALRLLEGGILWLIVRVLKPKLSLVFWILAVAGSIQALWGIWQFSLQDIFANKWLGVAAHPVAQAGSSVLLNEAGRWLRAYGGQAHPNILGGLLVITSLATVWLIVQTKEHWHKYLLISMYAVQMIGLFVAFSRAGWLAFFVSLAVAWWAVKDKRQHLSVMIDASVTVFIILGLSLWPITKARLVGSTAGHLEQQAIEERVTGIKESQSLFESAWWRGVGIGNYTKALSQYMPGLQVYRYQPVHNIFLLILTELGIAGLVLSLLFVWRRFKEFPRVLLVFLVPVAVTVWLDHYWWTSASMLLLFWLIMALPDMERANT